MNYHHKLLLSSTRTLYNFNVQIHGTNVAVKYTFLYFAFHGSAIIFPI